MSADSAPLTCRPSGLVRVTCDSEPPDTATLIGSSGFTSAASLAGSRRSTAGGTVMTVLDGAEAAVLAEACGPAAAGTFFCEQPLSTSRTASIAVPAAAVLPR